MSDQPISQVGRVNPELPNRAVQVQQVAAQIQNDNRQKMQPSTGAAGVNSNQLQNAGLTRAAEEQQKAQQQQTRQNEEPKMNANTSLRFQVDDKTNEVTILLVDRASGKVVQTIPSEAIKDLPAGELMQYSA
jgi:uncharacterized FlaG/YvyC family protein